MSTVRIIYLGTPDFAVEPLRALARDEHFQIVRVYTQPDKPAGRSLKIQPTPVKAEALKLGLDVVNVENINAPEVLKEIRELQVDSAVVVAFGQILKQEFLDIFPHKVVNVHSSLLPRWRGAAPMQRALMEGDIESGVALQIIVPQLDAGPVLGMRKVPLTDDIDIIKLYEILKHKSSELLTIEFMDYLRGNLAPLPQDDSYKTIAKKIKKEEGLINWSWPARKIFNYIRGLKGWPGTWTFRDGKILKIIEAKTLDKQTAKPFGIVTQVNADTFEVQCGQGTLQISMVQPESRAAMSASDYIRGYRLSVDDKLG